MESERLLRARSLIETRLGEDLDLEEMAKAAHFSRFHFLRVFRSTFFVTPHQYLIRRRVERAKELLADTGLSVTEICLEVGFESVGSFSLLFRKVVGWPPSHYRARVWEQRRNPRKFIPGCYIHRYGLDPYLPAAPGEEAKVGNSREA